MRRRALLLTSVLAAVAALTLTLAAGSAATRTPSSSPVNAQHSPPPDRRSPGPETPRPDHSPNPGDSPTPSEGATLPVDTPTSAPESTAPVPTGPAVGTESTPAGLLSVPAPTIGPTPQGGSGDVTLLILLVIIGLAVTAVGAFVLAIAIH